MIGAIAANFWVAVMVLMELCLRVYITHGGLVVSAEFRVVGKVVNDDHNAEEFLMVPLLLVFYHLVLRVDDSLQVSGS